MRRLLLVMLLAAQPTAAQTLYKWVDEKGVTHYSETPPDQGKSTKVEVKPGAPSKAAPDNWKDREIDSRQRRLERDKAEEERAGKNAKLAEEYQRRCRVAQQRVDDLNNTPILYELDDKGQRIYIEDKERPALMQKWSAVAKEYCR